MAAYGLPFAGREVHEAGDAVALLLRTKTARRLENQDAIVHALRPMLAQRGLRLVLLDEDYHR